MDGLAKKEINKFSKKYQKFFVGMTYEDLFQEGYLTYLNCLYQYETKGKKDNFISYFRVALKNNYLTLLYKEYSIRNIELPLDYQGYQYSESVLFDIYESVIKSKNKYLYQLLEALIYCPTYKDLARLLRKEEHGQKWSSAKITKIIRKLVPLFKIKYEPSRPVLENNYKTYIYPIYPQRKVKNSFQPS